MSLMHKEDFRFKMVLCHCNIYENWDTVKYIYVPIWMVCLFILLYLFMELNIYDCQLVEFWCIIADYLMWGKVGWHSVLTNYVLVL